ncbi:peptidyl-prolyl cis-trans isomerase-like [Musca vetustissima]|uniref:peptidyl-prolyl cis-trans isomerase-like n=1 Tax=Musca vetustissima TaxID=27455 RepID=UPI002AB5F779|nr:peptidyl-prolyl cis-trans isomerase-like [Musca vetustissima]
MPITEEFHKLAHAKHRKRVAEAKAIVDHKSPILHVGNFSRFSKLKDDVMTFVERNKANAELLVRMNEIFRTRGVTDSFRVKETALAATNLPIRLKELHKIEMENMKMGKRILCTTKELDTWQDAAKLRKSKTAKSHHGKFLVPYGILKKYSQLKLPQDHKELKVVLRPKVWFDLEVKNIRPLGRIVLQLYTEAAPGVVLEFIKLCSSGVDNQRLSFVRLFPSLWLEGNLRLPDKTLISRPLEYDKRAMDHGKYAGILSFSLDHLKYHKRGLFYFSISFKPLVVLNGRRIGFGRVVEGLKAMKSIDVYGTKNGKLTKEIVVSQCGIVK